MFKPGSREALYRRRRLRLLMRVLDFLFPAAAAAAATTTSYKSLSSLPFGGRRKRRKTSKKRPWREEEERKHQVLTKQSRHCKQHNEDEKLLYGPKQR
jgi:hypothetical protein